jgi:hypothetical protein
MNTANVCLIGALMLISGAASAEIFSIRLQAESGMTSAA